MNDGWIGRVGSGLVGIGQLEKLLAAQQGCGEPARLVGPEDVAMALGALALADVGAGLQLQGVVDAVGTRALQGLDSESDVPLAAGPGSAATTPRDRPRFEQGCQLVPGLCDLAGPQECTRASNLR